MGNTFRSKIVNSDKLTETCENAVNVLINGNEICKTQFGDDWKYSNIEKDNCEQRKFRGVCKYDSSIVHKSYSDEETHAPQYHDFPFKKMSTDKVKFPLQRKFVESKKIDIPENVSDFIDQRSLISPNEQFTTNQNNYNNNMTLLSSSIFLLILICVIFYFMSRK
ncbi:hypothetical protein Catovirus_2_27 [Catovirus CTV1]|uniref:Uncharacterized protein n=1 Tax=Catovirus CTV1 TaxID=1977631 RepID=A0A1V0SBP7_9VIRU|nr:hypothetical protein Catovirus_2_27 [Catovirus CTV1]